MVSLTKCVATVLVFATVTASVGAAACLLDCESQAAIATVPTASCHEGDSLDSAGVAITQSAVTCHRDHDGLAAELGLRNETASTRVAEVAHVRAVSTSSAETLIAGSAIRFPPQLTVQPPVGAPLPLRL
jgi:hypothetical protein